MRLQKMVATFGRLDGATLALDAGLNLIEAPNEAGKSTWSAFLRAMFYGINTKERDKQGFIAEKNRYLPWSGAAPEGMLALHWQGQDILLRRSQKGSTPFGKFEAVDAATGEAVPGLTGENAGEMILGVPREVFERSAFVGQGCAAVDGAPALEKRVAALVSSGEEDVSFSQVDRRLRDWINRRQHNRTGQIPALEQELAQLEETLARQAHSRRLSEDNQREYDRFLAEKAQLEAETAVHRHARLAEQWAQYEQAQAALDAAEDEVEALRAELGRTGMPPDRETLRGAQEDLNNLNTLHANIKLAETRRATAEARRQAAYAAARDPLFPDLTPEEAWQKATTDAAKAAALDAAAAKAPRGAWVGIGIGFLAGAALGAGGILLRGTLPFLSAPVGLALGAGVFLLASVCSVFSARRRAAALRQELQAILQHYSATRGDEILPRAADYRARCATAAEAAEQAETARAALTEMIAQRDARKASLLQLVHSFAPTVTDVFGMSAAISRALALGEKLSTAAVRLDGARRLAASVTKPPAAPAPCPAGVTPRYPYQETAALLAAVKGELNRLSGALAMAQGELNSLGDPVLLQAQRDACTEQLQQRRAEYAALELALDALARANSALQARFAPALNRRAGEILAALTGGKYDKITLTRDFEASAEVPGGVLPRRAMALSQGTMDQIYCAVRLAVCDLVLPEQDAVPLVLDDALANFDDARMALALDHLLARAEQRQILLFTCHSREGAYLAGRPGVTRATLGTESGATQKNFRE